MEARKVYAGTVKDRRSAQGGGRIPTGSARAKTMGGSWQQVSLQSQVSRLFPNEEVDYIVRNNGKIYIHPKNMAVGAERPIIVFDTSGDYFRISVGRKTPSGIRDTDRYQFANGQYMDTLAPGWTKERWMEATHFRATP